MRKYDKQDSEKAEAEIRSHLIKGSTYHEAAKNVAQHSPISVITLRRIAYRIAIREGYFTGTNLQHRVETRHGYLLDRCKKRLKNDGYSVISEQDEIRNFIESKGSKGNSDLVAIKAKEILFVEVIERAKAAAIFIDQLERYSKIGTLILVLPINTANIKIWGTQQLIS